MTEHAALFVGPSWVGDMVMAQAALKIYAAANPDTAIDIVAPGWSLPVVARMPEVRDGFALDTGHGEFGWGKRRALAKVLKPRQYAQAIVLPRSIKSALVPWMAGIPVRTGFRGESRYGLINDTRPFDRGVLDQTVKRFACLALPQGAVLAAIPAPRLRTDPDKQAALLRQLGLSDERPIVALMPGAEYGPAKCWPLEHFSELAQTLLSRDYSVWVLGSEKDHPAGEQISTAAPGAENLCGRTSLEDAVDLLGLASTAVSNDSGLMHIAAAVGCQVQAIYGSSSPDFTPPLTKQRVIHYLNLDCSPCFQRECPLGHLNCLKGIDPSAIMRSIVTKSG